MPIVNYDALREQVRNSYASPPPDILTAMLKEPNGPDLVEVQKIYADAFAEMAVATMKCIEQKVEGNALITAICMASVASLRNLLSRVDKGSRESVTSLAARHFAAGLDPDTEYVTDDAEPMPLNQ